MEEELALRAAKGDREAWQALAAGVRPEFLRWAVADGLESNDAEDVTQEILVRLLEKDLALFDPARGTFRGWARTVVRNAVRDHQRGQARARRRRDPTPVEELAEDPSTRRSATCEREEEDLMEETRTWLRVFFDGKREMENRQAELEAACEVLSFTIRHDREPGPRELAGKVGKSRMAAAKCKSLGLGSLRRYFADHLPGWKPLGSPRAS